MSYKFRDHIKNNRFVTTHVFTEDKFIYMRPGRSASTTIMRTIGGRNEEVSRPYYRKSGWSLWLENTTDEEILNDYFIFTFVRNPYTRLVSAWKALSRKGSGYADPNFKRFVMEEDDGCLINSDGEFGNDHYYPFCNYIEFSTGEPFVHFIGKVENIEEDWNKVKGDLKRNNTTINFVKTATNNDYKNYYDNEIIDRFNKLYKRDLELLDYEF